MNTSLFSKTPAVTVLDNRGLSVRSIAYHRHPDSPDDTGERITHHQYDARGFLTQSADPRLHDTGRANVKYLSDLVGNALCTVSADVGTTVALNDAAGRLFMTVSNIDTADDDLEDRSQAVNRTWQYEGASLPGRLLSITEQVTGEAARVTERFTYAANTDEKKALNLVGQCVSHYDTAGLRQMDSIALTGVSLSVTRRLLKDADNPDTVANWQGEDSSAWNDQLAADRLTTLTTADAIGAALTFVPYMWEYEHDKVVSDNGYLGVVARPGPFPIAMVHQGQWTVFDDSKELFNFYKSSNTPLPEHWQQNFIARGPGIVATPRHADVLDKRRIMH